MKRHKIAYPSLDVWAARFDTYISAHPDWYLEYVYVYDIDDGTEQVGFTLHYRNAVGSRCERRFTYNQRQGLRPFSTVDVCANMICANTGLTP